MRLQGKTIVSFVLHISDDNKNKADRRLAAPRLGNCSACCNSRVCSFSRNWWRKLLSAGYHRYPGFENRLSAAFSVPLTCSVNTRLFRSYTDRQTDSGVAVTRLSSVMCESSFDNQLPLIILSCTWAWHLLISKKLIKYSFQILIVLIEGIKMFKLTSICSE